MTWVVDKPEQNGTRIYDGEAEVTSGPTRIHYKRNNGGSVEYLQADLTTWSASIAYIAVAYVSDEGFLHDYTPDAGAASFSVTWSLEHDFGGGYEEVGTDTNYVHLTEPGDGGSSSGPDTDDLGIALRP